MSELTQDLTHFVEAFRVEPGTTVTLPDGFDPRFSAQMHKKDAEETLAL